MNLIQPIIRFLNCMCELKLKHTPPVKDYIQLTYADIK